MKGYQFEDLLNSPGGSALRQFVQEHLGEGGGGTSVESFESFERGLRSVVAALEREVIQQKLARYDVKVDRVIVDGVEYRRVLEGQTETYLSAAGEVTVARSLFVPTGKGGRSIVPLELTAGVVGGYWTPLAARQAAFAVSHLTPQEAESLFDEVGGMTPSRSSLDRLPKTLSDAWEPQRRQWEAALRELDPIPSEATIVAVSLDGVMVPMKDANEGKKASKSGGKAVPGYREAACATVSLYDQEGERLETVRYARMPEHKKTTITEQLKAEYDAIYTSAPELKLAKLADGADENWRILEEVAPGKGEEIVDFWHASEHLKEGLDAYHGPGTPESKAEHAKFRTLLKEQDGGAEQVIRALKYRRDRIKNKKRREVLSEQLTYFRRQQKRMDYPRYLREKLPIGSGVVEAACKTLVTQRCKQSGMSWSIPGGQGILTLRSLVQSDRWQDGWHLLAGAFTKTVHLPKKGNVLRQAA